MNIFITSKCPKECAKFIDDKRVVKMCLETAQMLCTAVNEMGGNAPYKSTHKNHPCNIWARLTRSNWLWLWNHGKALCKEYTYRYGKKHKCEDILDNIIQLSYYIPIGVLTEFPNCAANKSLGISYKHLETTLAYKMYLKDRWASDKRIPTRYKVSIL